MVSSWRNIVDGLLKRTGLAWSQWSQIEIRTVLAVTNDPVCKMNLRVLSLEQGWRILFADSVEDALRVRSLHRIGVLVYDRALRGADWRQGLRRLICCEEPLIPIVVSDVPDARLRSEVLNCGGYDLARNPPERGCFASLVNGALRLAESMDSIEA